MISAEQKLELVNLIEKKLFEFEGYKSCLNCFAFNEEKETCGIAGHVRPPARVIAQGCEQWDEDIPF